MSVIKKICGRVAVMAGGRVVEHGDVFDIFSRPAHSFTRQIVERTFNIELPERLMQHVHGTLLKILFLGESAEHPVLSQAALRFGVSINILHGKIEYVNDRAIGLMVALLTDLDQGPNPVSAHPPSEPASGRIAAAIAHIRAGAARVEVLRG